VRGGRAVEAEPRGRERRARLMRRVAVFPVVAPLALSAVFEVRRRLPVAPGAARALWLEETWARGRYGLPLPPPVDLGGGRRLVAPPGLVEALEDGGDDEIRYAVRNPGWASLYPVSRHGGAVAFEASPGGATEMTWRVAYEPLAGRWAAAWTAFLTKTIVTAAADELARIAAGGVRRRLFHSSPFPRSSTPAGDLEPSPVERWVIRRVLDWFRDSDVVRRKHAAHVASETAAHLLQDSPLAGADAAAKRRFAASAAGRLVARVVREEGAYLGDWKRRKVVEAAGPDFDADAAAADLRARAAAAPIVVFSFADCPWCVAAVELLAAHYPGRYADVPVEPLGRRGKRLRAAIALETGRTSLPAVFVRGEPIGGYTDGDPAGDGLLARHRRGDLLRPD